MVRAPDKCLPPQNAQSLMQGGVGRLKFVQRNVLEDVRAIIVGSSCEERFEVETVEWRLQFFSYSFERDVAFLCRTFFVLSFRGSA